MTAPSEQLLAVTFDVFQFLAEAILSAVSFCNVTRNVNKKFLQIALLKPTPYRISMPVSLLEDLTHYFQ